MVINFISQRHIIDTLIEREKIPRGGSIVMISSLGGLGWIQNLENILDFLDTPDWDTAVRWINAHEGMDNYRFSKQAMCGYVAKKALDFRRRGIRINSVMPGPTDTPMARGAGAAQWQAFGAAFWNALDIDPLTSEEIARTMVFFASNAAAGVTGTNLPIDHGQTAAGITGTVNDPVIKALMRLG